MRLRIVIAWMLVSTLIGQPIQAGDAGTLDLALSWTADGDQDSCGFGVAVASASDVNGDGFSDVIVGAGTYDGDQIEEGRVFVYYGSPDGLDSVPSWTAESDQSFSKYGESVAAAGDVNGDGYSDVVVGARFYDDVEMNEGRAFVYLGSATGLSQTADWFAGGGQAGANFGFSVASAGDLNGDGFSDVIVGAPWYTTSAEVGRASVFHGSAVGLPTLPSWSTEGEQDTGRFGISVASAGDVNGDGFSDVIVGASRYGNGEALEGQAFVYHGSPIGLSQTPSWIGESDQADARFGFAVASAGDVDGDGYADVIVGAYRYDNGELDEGRVFVYHGSPTGLSAAPVWIAESDQESSSYGRWVASAGDVNADGYSDVLVGASNYDNGENAEGRVFLYLGSPTGLEPDPAWTAESDQPFGLMSSVDGAADVDADGFEEVIVGAPLYDNGESNEGRAYVFTHSGATAAGRTASLVVGKGSGSSLELSWLASCTESDTDYAVYEGTIGEFSDHAAVVCSTGGLTMSTVMPPSGNMYYLIVPSNSDAEGSYGVTSDGGERPPGTAACRSLQRPGAC